MNRQEHLLVVLSEECLEVAHAISKSLRFGLDDHFYERSIENKKLISAEMADLMGAYFKLLKEGVIDAPEESLITDKEIRIEKFLTYSRERGTLKD